MEVQNKNDRFAGKHRRTQEKKHESRLLPSATHMAPTTGPKPQQGENRENLSDNGKPQEPPAHEPPAPSPSSSSVGDNLAQALKDLARGEQTASTLEANLTNLEGKLDEILASFGVSAADLDALDEQEAASSSSSSSSQKGQKGAAKGGDGKGPTTGEDNKKGGA